MRYTSSGDEFKCEYCDGRGQVKDYFGETCPTCGGSGESCFEVTCQRCKGMRTVTCSRCRGTGHAVCKDCDGSGRVKCSKCDGKGRVSCHECHGGENHVCVDCYGTGNELPESGGVHSAEGMAGVVNGVALLEKKEYVKAFETFRDAAVKHGSPVALRKLALMYERGQAVYESQDHANDLYALAANAGDVWSLYFLGLNYAKGAGVRANPSEARRLLEIATAKGCSDAAAEYLKVASAKLTTDARSGVVGGKESFDVPRFLREADPAADQRDKDAKVAARKAEEERRMKLERRKERWRARRKGMVEKWEDFCDPYYHRAFSLDFFSSSCDRGRGRGRLRLLAKLLFRLAAFGTFALGTVAVVSKGSYDHTQIAYVSGLVASLLVCSYAIRPRFQRLCVFIELGLIVWALFVSGYLQCFVLASCLFAGLITFAMRSIWGVLKMPILSYPLLGVTIGLSASPYFEAYGGTGWQFACLLLAGVCFCVNFYILVWKKRDEDDGQTSWVKTLFLLAICGAILTFIVRAVVESPRIGAETEEAIKSEIH